MQALAGFVYLPSKCLKPHRRVHQIAQNQPCTVRFTVKEERERFTKKCLGTGRIALHACDHGRFETSC